MKRKVVILSANGRRHHRRIFLLPRILLRLRRTLLRLRLRQMELDWALGEGMVQGQVDQAKGAARAGQADREAWAKGVDRAGQVA